jgi:predicted nucleic acid-binding protein
LILYLDTSSLVKYYLEELHSESVHAWVDAADLLATSCVTLPEATAAFSRRCETGSISSVQRNRAAEALLDEWETYIAVELYEHRAALLAVDRRLRGFDAVQLAAALTLRDGAGAESLVFSSFDAELNAAARAEGLTVLEPLG